MKKIASLHGLKTETGANENVWLLLYKKGSEQSDCALENFQRAGEAAAEMKKNNVLCSADVNEVKDIHPEFGVTTVPALLYFEKGQLRNLVKGCHRPEQFNAIFDKSAATVVANGEKKPQKSVTVYTTPTCTWCNTIKRHFQENGINYREVDVSRDQKAAEEMVRRSGQQGVPQTDINGEMIVGFDKTRINSLLGIN
ncbi:Glutaredoxin-like protein, YruB-family [Mariniphaga anaerophila]|uniref:Glutaredoxin-like protein, YruB-family n=1 Tax=Mariniphaga anaerophila TaxID=1484053 RepID=A0A1M5DG68_9BACT|nr:thioredoxin family protein [Mariniphaga anaerophila]SHF65915.1 Glutaredoxin-like protein, YruB-family [Mariniphaga anaerophila]